MNSPKSTEVCEGHVQINTYNLEDHKDNYLFRREDDGSLTVFTLEKTSGGTFRAVFLKGDHRGQDIAIPDDTDEEMHIRALTNQIIKDLKLFTTEAGATAQTVDEFLASIDK